MAATMRISFALCGACTCIVAATAFIMELGTHIVCDTYERMLLTLCYPIPLFNYARPAGTHTMFKHLTSVLNLKLWPFIKSSIFDGPSVAVKNQKFSPGCGYIWS